MIHIFINGLLAEPSVVCEYNTTQQQKVTINMSSGIDEYKIFMLSKKSLMKSLLLL